MASELHTTLTKVLKHSENRRMILSEWKTAALYGQGNPCACQSNSEDLLDARERRFVRQASDFVAAGHATADASSR